MENEQNQNLNVVPPPTASKLSFLKLEFIKVGLGVLIALVLFSGGFILGNNTNIQKVCTMEAKTCPDGSSVGRTGPKCEFAPCPIAKSTPTITSINTFSWKTYINSDLGFSFKYPSESKLQVNCHDCETADIDISFPNDKYTIIQMSSSSNYDKDKPTVRDIVDSLIYVRNHSTDPYVQQIRSPITLDGVIGEKLFSEEKIGDFTRNDIEIYVIKDKKLYSIDFRFEPKNKQRMSTLADQILSSFKFTQ
jgi:hypothetical protein